MMKLDSLATLVAIAEAGSISAAARRLGIAKSVASERLSELERELGAQLIRRSTRKLSFTEDGQTFLPRARSILREATEASAELAERRGTLAGPLRLSAPVSFGMLHLGPALNAFLSENSGIELTLDLDDRFVDVASEGYDAVLRHGPVDNNRLVAKRLAKSRRLLVASPAYLASHGRPATPAELAGHAGILYANREADWRFGSSPGWTVVRPRAVLRVNNGVVMREAAVAGLGIALLPTFFMHEQLADGSAGSCRYRPRGRRAPSCLSSIRASATRRPRCWRWSRASGAVSAIRPTGIADSAEQDRRRPLFLGAPGALPVALVMSGQRKGRQPGFAPHGPEFVGRHELVRGVERAEIDLDLVFAAAENRRAAARAKMPSLVVVRFALDRYRSLGEDRGGMKQRAVMLAAVETVAEADPVGASRRNEADGAAKAPAGESSMILLPSITERTSRSAHCVRTPTDGKRSAPTRQTP